MIERGMKRIRLSDNYFEKSEPLNKTPRIEIKTERPRPARGLSNLGNTCFYNSTMQCLMHTHSLYKWQELITQKRELLINKGTVVVNEKKVEVPDAVINLEKNQPSRLINALNRFLDDFRIGRNPNPSSLFDQISLKAPMFRDWEQQDAHELLCYLLDGIRTEELKRFKDAIFTYMGVEDKSDPEKLLLCKAMLESADRCYVDSIFGGSLLQCIMCSKCKHVSNSLEHFLNLSLPLRYKTTASPPTVQCSPPRCEKKLSKGKIRKLKKMKKKEAKKARRIKRAMEKNGQIQNLQDDSSRRPNYNIMLAPPPSTENDAFDNLSVTNSLKEFTANEIFDNYECESCCAPHNKKLPSNSRHKRTVEASKKYLIYSPPCVLTVHLKRQVAVCTNDNRMRIHKIRGHVDFPLTLDVSQFCSRNGQRIRSNQNEVIYSLYGIVSHSGGSGGGHYIAYVKSRNKVESLQQFMEAGMKPDRLCQTMKELRNGISSQQSINPNLCKEEIIRQLDDGATWYYASDSIVRAINVNEVIKSEAYILFYERIV